MNFVSLGDFSLQGPFLLAPMAGITHLPFRLFMRKRGSSASISELLSAKALVQGNQKTQAWLRFDERERPFGVQIFGSEPKVLTQAAKRVEQSGADFVDLNLGCPVPKVIRKGAGAALARDLKKLAFVLAQIKKTISIPLTLKVRTGWSEEEKNIFELVHIAQEEGVMWVAIHGRTRAQGYSGASDWDLIGKVKARARIPIIGNGDLNTAQKILWAYRSFGVDAVMVGRGVLRNPFLLLQAKQLLDGNDLVVPSGMDYWKAIETLWAALKTALEPRQAFLNLKKFLAWFSSGYPQAACFRREVFVQKEEKVLLGLGKKFFLSLEEKQNERIFSEPFLMGGHG